jgi:tRNA 2-thiouridine synthesizing protein A
MPLSSPQPECCGEAIPAGVLAGSCHAIWDAGDLACGELILELRLRMRRLDSGQVLRLTACDPGAPADIPAWCRMTGNALLRIDPAAHLYFIQRP